MKVRCPTCGQYFELHNNCACGFNVSNLYHEKIHKLIKLADKCDDTKYAYIYYLIGSERFDPYCQYKLGHLFYQGIIKTTNSEKNKRFAEHCFLESAKNEYYNSYLWLINHKNELGSETRASLRDLEDIREIKNLIVKDKPPLADIYKNIPEISTNCFNDLNIAYRELKNKNKYKISDEQMKVLLSYAFVIHDLDFLKERLKIDNIKQVFEEIKEYLVLDPIFNYENTQFGVYVGNKTTSYGQHSRYSRHYYNKR